MSSNHCPNLGSFFLLLFLTVPEAWAGPLVGKPDEPQAPRPGLSSLPAEAKASISAALGRDQRAYMPRNSFGRGGG